MKAIVTDLDRTLLRTDKSISPYTLDILKTCHDQGFLLMAASARPLRDVLIYHKQIGFDAITATNGAVVSLPDRILEYGIPTEIGEEILSKLLVFPDLFLSVETSNGLYSNRDIPEWQPVVYDRFPKLPPGIILYKILASSQHPSLYQGIETALNDDVYHTIANHALVQIMSRKATKWNGVQHMLSCFALSPGDAVYFGDDNDDLDGVARFIEKNLLR